MLGRFITARSAPGIAAVGALFAISFDTVSLAVLFALAAVRMGGLAGSLFVALVFALGMLAVDGLNGLWISHLIRKSDRTAAVASRTIALAIAGVSFSVALLALSRLGIAAFDVWMDKREGWVSVGVVALVLAAFAAGQQLSRRRAAVSPSG
jgi:high-affinity nickel-transport protein